MRRKRSEVVELILKGYSNPQIAKELGIAEKTVKDHLWREFKKFSVKNKLEYIIMHHNKMRSLEHGKIVASIITEELNGVRSASG